MSRRHPLGIIALALLIGTGCTTERDPAPDPRGVVLVILDTVRADHLSAYGYERPTTPFLDELAAEGERYDSAWSPSPWTLPSIATILTGELPHVHGAGRGESRIFPLREEVATLAERVAERGYPTAAFMNVVWVHPGSGLGRGFALYDYEATDETNRVGRDARGTTEAALAWLRERGDEPFLLVVHYFDPHLTYDPPAPFDAMFDADPAGALPEGFGSKEQVFAIREGALALSPAERETLIARHDGELRFVDEELRRLQEALDGLDLWDDTTFIVVGDHGEEFWDHGGFEHGHTHHRELLRVPLIVRRPGGPEGLVRRERVRLIDVAPTVLAALHIPVPDSLPGRVLGTRGADHAVAEGSLWSGDLVSVRSDRGTLILDRASGETRFYAPGDELEQHPLPYEPVTDATLLEILRALPPLRGADAREWQPTDEELERLRSLGYVR